MIWFLCQKNMNKVTIPRCHFISIYKNLSIKNDLEKNFKEMIKVTNVITQNMLLISRNLIWNYYYFVIYLSKLFLSINFIHSFMNFMNLYKAINCSLSRSDILKDIRSFFYTWWFRYFLWKYQSALIRRRTR